MPRCTMSWRYSGDAILANVLVACVAAAAWALQATDPTLYYLSVQEDELVEWASFWSFAAAGALYLRHAFADPFTWRGDWCSLALAAFCLFVALEEISWGQRLLGYRPPEYFLAANFQQELNLHNVVATDLRKLALRAVIFGYGVALPLVMLAPVVRRHLDRLGIVAPPARLIPAFLAAGILQLTYPVKFTGEWVELMLGLCFLYAALLPAAISVRGIALAGTAVVAAGFGTATLTRMIDDPQRIPTAQAELDALGADFAARRVRSRCGVHKRLFTFAEQYAQDGLYRGEFATLTDRGLPETRAAYLLDPWNTAYWLRDNCADGERARTTLVYSFGPNRRRDSTKWEIGGDDIAVFVRGKSQ